MKNPYAETSDQPNILLDANLMAKVADFSISKLILDGGAKGYVSNQVKGTMVITSSIVFLVFLWEI